MADEAQPPLSEGQKALAEAQETGKRVEVTGERSERTMVFANPDGFTFTLEESAVPVRVPTAGGGWQAPDATLEVRADGTVVPKAAAVEMEFSGGGAKDPLVKISDTGRSLRISWPGKLPEPEVDGASAVYPEVLSGVDLRITASVEGFRHVLVVKSPEAAVQEEMKEIDYALKATGLSLLKGKAGNLTAIDDDGNRVFRAPPAQMVGLRRFGVRRSDHVPGNGLGGCRGGRGLGSRRDGCGLSGGCGTRRGGHRHHDGREGFRGRADGDPGRGDAGQDGGVGVSAVHRPDGDLG
ncbi:hypothetical protein [Streptomyces scabiei]|uniref:hypothetical protein n=1 Tax=Streptomyces scabiei TaxID=1930 RepID=UPI0039F65832